jgi:hypothetical protein
MLYHKVHAPATDLAGRTQTTTMFYLFTIQGVFLVSCWPAILSMLLGLQSLTVNFGSSYLNSHPMTDRAAGDNLSKIPREIKGTYKEPDIHRCV